MRMIIAILILSSCTPKTIAHLQGEILSGDGVTITWKSLDNSVVDSPTILNSKITMSSSGSHKFEISGVDKYGNKAKKDTVIVTVK